MCATAARGTTVEWHYTTTTIHVLIYAHLQMYREGGRWVKAEQLFEGLVHLCRVRGPMNGLWP